ncbi:hypothetical protein HU200_043726 [Digitaria exilis]|uniref:Uncharacterized protein n=1 Tax=Digitaria exilis TaxID=1010633 RepID=A0A835EEM3_9POAL|nr:hypothetical protein HU200_043726 [Digitaria exilis]
MHTFKMLSLKPLWPPRLEHEFRYQISYWSWRNLPMPTFKSVDVTSYAVDSDGRTILASTAAATFAFDPQCHEWRKRLEWSLPFSGRAYFVHGLDVFVGLTKDVDTFGHLCFCRWLLGGGGDDEQHDVWFSKENLSSKDPAKSHVGTTLVYLGENRFCLVECVRNGDVKAVQKWLEELDGQEDHIEESPLSARCRLTTFSLSSEMNGGLMAAKTAVQCYKVPMEACCFNVNPVAFWL